MLVNRTSITSFLLMNLTDLINTDIAHNYPWTLYTLDNFSWTVISLMIPITDTICFVRPTLWLSLLLIWHVLDSLSNPCFHPMIYANWQIYFESWSKKTWSKAQVRQRPAHTAGLNSLTSALIQAQSIYQPAHTSMALPAELVKEEREIFSQMYVFAIFNSAK